MIEIDNISKTYQTKNGPVHALKNVTLKVKKGDIYGVVGYSGAGKSTLIRMVNGLEQADSGSVKVNGKEIVGLNENELNKIRTNIGMVFQQFNLLEGQTVHHNVALPLIIQGADKDKTKKRVKELLSFVGLADRDQALVSTLSGGQKQRVGIARALATSPDILLCDEATSALDPETTDQILELLYNINQDLGVTILLITHEMEVVKKICNKVAVMESGEIVEEGSTIEVFEKPVQSVTQKFVNTVIDQSIPQKIAAQITQDTPVIKVVFRGDNAGDAVLYEANKRFDVKTSILNSSINEFRDEVLGVLFIKLEGQDSEIEKLLDYLESVDVNAERVEL